MRLINLTRLSWLMIHLAASVALLSLTGVNVARAGGGLTVPYNYFLPDLTT